MTISPLDIEYMLHSESLFSAKCNAEYFKSSKNVEKGNLKSLLKIFIPYSFLDVHPKG